MTVEDWQKLDMEVSKVFTPSAPVDVQKLFAGRIEQVRDVIDAVNQKGQHVIIFGERGVGKTSLANIIKVLVSAKGQVGIRINTDNADDYNSLWHKVFNEINIIGKTRKMGFGSSDEYREQPVIGTLIEPDKEVTLGSIRQILTNLSNQAHLVIIIDEFDRLKNDASRSAVADTIKTLSDHSMNVTLILVGVADSVDELIKEHQSIERALKQIQMPRMSNKELQLIIQHGLDFLKMTIEDDAKKYLTLLSQGLPHYTHLLCLHSVRQAIDAKTKVITLKHVEAAISRALAQAQQTTRSAYTQATTSPRKDNMFVQVLLACALAKTDDLGYFAAADVREPLNLIMNKKLEIFSFSRHLNVFCENIRGSILSKIGRKHNYRFRFRNPLMQPFVVLQGVANKLIDKNVLESEK